MSNRSNVCEMGNEKEYENDIRENLKTYLCTRS